VSKALVIDYYSDVLFTLIEMAGLKVSLVNKILNDGTAMAELMLDYQQAKAQYLKGSPSSIIDNGRQVLYGNVGYRVLLENIEAVKSTENEAVYYRYIDLTGLTFTSKN